MKTEHKRNGIGAGAVVAAVVVVILIAGAGYFIFAPGSSSSTTTSTSLTTTTSTTPTTSTTTTSTTTTSSTTTSTTASGAQTVTVDLPSGVGSNQQLNFSPASLTVAVGTTIDFVSQDTATHDIDFTSVPTGSTVAQGTTSPNLKNGNSYTVTLTTPGTYTYVCDYHNWMKGTIVVGGSGTTTTTSSTSTTSTTTSSSATSTTTKSTSSGSSTTVVTMPAGVGADMTATFSPATITVVVGVNNTIVWTNDDTAVHNVDFQTGPSGATLPSTSVNVRNGQSTPAITLTVPGTYTYVCDYHNWMKATIVVVAAA
jgi:plastocyanin